MALKDWKETFVGDIYELNKFFNKKKDVSLVIYQNPSNDNFDVLLQYEDDEDLLNTFKTLPASLKFAKSYMEKH